MNAEHGPEGTGLADRLGTTTPEDLSRLLTTYRAMAAALARRAGASRFYLEALEAAARVVEADRSILCRIDAIDDRYLRVSLGSGALARLEGTVLPRTGSFEGAAFESDHGLIEPALGENASYFRTPDHRNAIGPAIAVRIEGGDGAPGVLLAARAPGAEPFAERHVAMLEELAGFVAAMVAIADPAGHDRDGWEAVEAWQETRAARDWVAVCEEVLAARGEAAFRLAASGALEWGASVTRLFGARAESLPESVEALLGRLRPEDRIAVQATLRDLMTGSEGDQRPVVCTLDAGRTDVEPLQLRIWRAPGSAGLVGVIGAAADGGSGPDNGIRKTADDPVPTAEGRNDDGSGEAAPEPTPAGTPVGSGNQTGEASEGAVESPSVSPPPAEENMITVVQGLVDRSERESPAPVDPGAAGLTDLHSHLLVAVDDGAASEPEAVNALARAHAAGVRSIVVTPHVRVSAIHDAEREELTGTAYARLVEIGAERHPDLTIHRGAEVMLDVPRGDVSASWLRLAGTRFALVEFAGMWIPPRSIEVLRALIDDGYTPVVAHPERYGNAEVNGRDALEWKDAGARLQVNCGSLLGYYGAGARERAWRLLETGVVDYLASDYHSRGEYPVEECVKALESYDGGGQARLLLAENPARLLRGEDPVEVSPVTRPPSLLQRIANARLFW